MDIDLNIAFGDEVLNVDNVENEDECLIAENGGEGLNVGNVDNEDEWLNAEYGDEGLNVENTSKNAGKRVKLESESDGAGTSRGFEESSGGGQEAAKKSEKGKGKHVAESPENPTSTNANSTQNCEFDAKEIEDKLSLGSIVASLDQAFLLYCEYARCMGFSVRKGEQRYIGRTNEIRWKEFKCSCNGLSNGVINTGRLPIYQKQLIRTDCKAKIRVSRAGGGPWKVIFFQKSHNHDLVPPEQSYLLRSARNMSHAKKSILEAMHSAGIGVSRACKFIEDECGGPQNVGFTRKDAYAHIARNKKETKLENADANKILQYFIKKSNANPFFSWDVDFDDDGRIMNFFFRDAKCAVDYEAFGDVLSVDTTYRTNKYNLICAPFVGINHHANNIMFGMGFLSDETTSTFEWLFKTFLHSMNDKQPVVIFTDQCQAMMNAIDNTFPNSTHRLCQWHINQNAPSHFGSLNGNPTFKRLWHKLMNHVETADEFEELWSDMMTTYRLSNHKWFKGMYNLRHRWASVFTSHLFTAGLLATSRSEVTNKVLKDVCRSSSSLYEFVRGYEQIQNRWRVKEKAEDTYCLWMPGQFVKNNRLLTHAASVYTRTIYHSFDFEAAHSFNVILDDLPVNNDSDNILFKASCDQLGPRRRSVTFNRSSHHASCSCRMWESEGIFCRHIIKVYNVMNVFAIPEAFILKRWTVKAKLRTWTDTSESEARVGDGGVLPYMTFLNQIMRYVHDMCSSAKEDKDARGMIMQRIDALRQEVSNIIGVPEVVESKSRCKSRCNPKGVEHPRDPAKIYRHWDNKKGKKRAADAKPNRVGKCNSRHSKQSEAERGIPINFMDPARFDSSQSQGRSPW